MTKISSTPFVSTTSPASEARRKRQRTTGPSIVTPDRDSSVETPSEELSSPSSIIEDINEINDTIDAIWERMEQWKLSVENLQRQNAEIRELKKEREAAAKALNERIEDLGKSVDELKKGFA